MKIFKVTGSIDKDGFRGRVVEIEVTESNKSYHGEGRLIRKHKIMLIDTVFLENHTSLRYFTYCLEGDQQKALDMLKAHIIEKVKKYKSEIDKLYSYIL